MNQWRGRERRSGEQSALASDLARLADGQDRIRESLHDLRNGAATILLRVDRLERDFVRLDGSVDSVDQVIQQLRGALATMRVLTGGSLITAAAATAAMGRSLGWW